MNSSGIHRPNGLSMRLSAPGMTALHRAGLAGLWMTLDALGGEKKERPKGGYWKLLDDGVDIILEGKPDIFFTSLFKQSFKVEDGCVWLPALWRPRDDPEASALLNECLLGTFLQHGKTRKADAANNPKGQRVVTVDEVQHPLLFRRIFSYAHQNVKVDRLDTRRRFVGWLYPGSAVRHEAFDVTGMEEPLEMFLPLLYSIVGVLYFVIRKSGTGIGHAVVIPDVVNLKDYALFRSRYAPRHERDLIVSGGGEAALRLLTILKARKLTHVVGSTVCRVMIFGKVQWDKQQRKRIQVFDIGEGVTDLSAYEKCRQFFPARLVKPENGAVFWDLPQIPELVAKNIIAGRRWWVGLSQFVSDKDVGDHVFGISNGHLYKGEKEGLAKMVSDVGVGEEAESAFVEACHEAWRRRLGKLGQSARETGRPFGDLVQKEFLKTRLSFARCKNEATMREALSDFWAKGGSLPSLQSNWRAVLSLINKDWRLAKDLALLALASYASREEEEIEVL